MRSEPNMPDQIHRAAEALRLADETRTPTAPIRDLVGTSTDIDTGYAIQQVNTDLAVASGRRISGRKIGVTSRAVQAQIGVDQPDFGTLFCDTEYGNGVDIPSDRLIQPRAEAEVALVLGDDLDNAPHGFAQVIRAVAFALPAIEIVDSRIANWDISIVDTVADNASCGVYVLGNTPVRLSAFDARTVPMRMSVNSETVSTGVGAACLGNPLQAARWLADTLCERNIPLRAGDVVLTGALGPMVALQPGDGVTAHLGELGTVATRLMGRA
jgi:2-keto-4-pentenoate hydratase